jgi:hypothetical protein
MSVEIACPQCNGILKAPPGMEGKKARCKRCGHSFRIPGGGSSGSNDSVGDASDLSVVGESPFAFQTTTVPKADARDSKTESKTTSKDANPFTIPSSESLEGMSSEPKSKVKYRTKPEQTESAAKASGGYRSKATKPAGNGKWLTYLLAGFLCAGGGAGGFYAYMEYQKSKSEPSASAAKTLVTELETVPTTANPVDDKARKSRNHEISTQAAGVGRVEPDRKPPAPKKSGPKVLGGLKLPPFADLPKLHEKASTVISLDHDSKSVKQVQVGGMEGPVVLVTRRTFDGLGGKGTRDTIDRYALNTLRRIDQTEIPADAARTYPRISDIGPGGDRYAFEHPEGKLTVVQLGTKTILVDALNLTIPTEDSGKSAHPGIAALYFLTDEKLAIVTKAGVVESWDLTAKKRIGASEPFPGVSSLVGRKYLAFHRDRDPEKCQIIAFSGGAIHSVTSGGKPQLALTLPHGAKECLALAVDGSGNRLAIAYRATEPGEHIRFLHSRLGDPKPGTDQSLDAEIGVPTLVEWTRPEAFSILTDKGLGLAWDADTNQLIAGFRTLAPTMVVADGEKHWVLLPDPKDVKKAVLVNVTIPPEDYSPSLTGDKWKPLALTITADGIAK